MGFFCCTLLRKISFENWIVTPHINFTRKNNETLKGSGGLSTGVSYNQTFHLSSLNFRILSVWPQLEFDLAVHIYRQNITRIHIIHALHVDFS